MTLTDEEIVRLNEAIHHTPASMRTLQLRRDTTTWVRRVFEKGDDDRQDEMKHIIKGTVCVLVRAERCLYTDSGIETRCYFSLENEGHHEFNFSLGVSKGVFNEQLVGLIDGLIRREPVASKAPSAHDYNGFGDWS